MPEASGGQAASDGSRPVPNLILTQDDVSAAEWRTLLDTAGIVTCHWPAFQIEALPDADILTAFDGGADGVVLPSPAAVRVVSMTGKDRVLWHEWSRTMLETLSPYPGESY